MNYNESRLSEDRISDKNSIISNVYDIALAYRAVYREREAFDTLERKPMDEDYLILVKHYHALSNTRERDVILQKFIARIQSESRLDSSIYKYLRLVKVLSECRLEEERKEIIDQIFAVLKKIPHQKEKSYIAARIQQELAQFITSEDSEALYKMELDAAESYTT